MKKIKLIVAGLIFCTTVYLTYDALQSLSNALSEADDLWDEDINNKE